MRSLSWKLGGSLLLIVILSVGLMAYFTNLNTNREFIQYLTQGNQKYSQNIGSALAQYYSGQGNWQGIQSLLLDFLRSANDRLVLADASGRVVGDTEDTLIGATAAGAGLSGGVSIVASGDTVGQLYLLAIKGNSGKGFAKGQGKNAAVTTSVVTTAADTAQQDFIARSNNSLLITGLIVAAVALVIGLVLTRQITRPIRLLVNGVRQIARGNLHHRVDIRSRDELNELGQSFNSMAASLDKAEQERQRMVADIAHDLRTPLTVIEGTVTGIQDGVFQPDKEHLDVIKEQTSLLTRLTGDLRELSLAESGRLKLAMVPTDISDLLGRIAAQFSVKAGEKGLTIKATLPPGLPMVNADPARIERILGNLLSNAVRHTPSGGTITVSAAAIDNDTLHGISKPAVIVSVADTGEGIAPEHLPHVFERFYRIDESRSRNQSGSGLGLAIVQQLVQAHGGKTWAESAPDKGSVFYFSLPLPR